MKLSEQQVRLMMQNAEILALKYANEDRKLKLGIAEIRDIPFFNTFKRELEALEVVL